MSKQSSSGGFGCISTIVFIILVWALVFGFTYNGKHYGLKCSTNNGVEVHH
jgi:hypothetical protein